MNIRVSKTDLERKNVDLVGQAAESFTPVEPRILLDAVLDLDPTDLAAAGTSDILHAIAGGLDDQVAKLRDTFDTLQDQFADTLGAAGGLLDPNGSSIGGDASSNLRAAGEVFDTVKTAINSALERFENDINGFVDDNASAITSVLNTAFNNDFGITDLLAVDGSDVRELLSFDTVSSIASFENTFNTVIGNAFETAFEAANGVEAVVTDFETLYQSARDGFIDFAVTSAADLFQIELTDIEIDGRTVVAFSNDGGATDKVSIEVSGPDISFDVTSFFNSIGIDAKAFGADDLVLEVSDLGFNFDLSTAFDAVENLYSLTADNFDIGDLTFGGAFFGIGDDVDFSIDLGLLTAEITEFAIAEFQVAVTGIDTISAIASFDFDTFVADLTFAADPFGVDLQIKEVGAADFASVVDDQTYNLASAQVAGSLSLASGDEPIDADDLLEANQTARDFIVDLSLAGLVSTAEADVFSAFVDSLDVGFDVDLSGLGLAPEEEEQLEAVVSSLVGMGATEVAAAFQSFAERLDEILASDLFDFELPFTSLEFADAFGAIGVIADSILDSFKIDLSSLGFGAVVELFSSGGGSLFSGDIDLALFDGVGSFDLIDFNTGDILVTVSSPDIAGGFVDLDALISAIQAAFDAASVDISVDLAGLGLGFTLKGDAASDFDLGFGNVFDTGGLDLNLELRDLLGFPDLTSLAFSLDDIFDAASRFGDSIDLSFFDGVGSFTFGDSTTADDVVLATVISPNAGGGFASLDELLQAIADAFDIAGLSIDISKLGDGLNFSLPRGSVDGVALNFGSLFDLGGVKLPDLELRSILGFSAFSDLTLNFQSLTVSIAEIDLSGLKGAKELVFSLFEGTTEHKIKAATVDAGGNPLDLAAILANIKLGLPDVDFDIQLTGDGLGFDFLLSDEAQTAYRFGIDAADQFLGLNLETLLAWGNDQLADLLPGAGLALDDEGRLQFLLPDLGGEVGFADTSFSLADLGFDLIGGLDLSAEISGSIAANISSNLAIDLGQFAGDAVSLLNGRAQGDAPPSQTSLLDSIFVQNTEVFGRVTAAATNIQGQASIGFITAEFGRDDPGSNFINLDAQLQATLIGKDADGVFSSSVSFSQIRDAASGGDLNDLIGRVDLAGGLVVNEDGTLVDDALIDEDNIFEAELEDGQISAIVVLQLGDVTIDVAGVSGLTEDAINGVSVVIPDLFNTDSFIVDIDSPLAEALTGLNSGDLLDSLTNLATLLSTIGTSLADDLPFLATDIPVLGFNVLDVLDFGTDFLEGVQQFRNDPAGAFDGIEDALEDVFGEDTVAITWDATEFILGFALDIEIVDGGFTTPFAIDLVELLGDQLEAAIGSVAVEIISSLVDARGDGSLIIDPEISLGLAFGIDLSALLEEPSTIAAADTALALLATASVVTGSTPAGRNDLRVTRTDAATGTQQTVSLKLADEETLGDAVTALNAALATGFGDATVGDEEGALASFEFDEETGVLTLTDLNSVAIDRAAGVDALFGEDAGLAEDAGDGAQVVGTADITAIDFAAGFEFDVNIGDERATVTIAADAGRTDLVAFIEAANAALAEVSIDRSAISDTALFGTKVDLDQLVTLSVEDGETALVLSATNFAEANGYEEFEFGVDGKDVSVASTYKIDSINGSNIARLLGFESGKTVASTEFASQVIFEAIADDRVRVFLDTENTGLKLRLLAGAQDLNVTLGAGPIEINVVGGKALINAGDGTGDAARFNLGFNDIDGDDNDGQFDLSALGTIFNDPAQSFLDLLNVDAAIGLDIDLPFSDTLGLFDPDVNSLTWATDLLATDVPTSLGDFDLANITDFFDGALIDFQLDGAFDFDDITFDFPDIGAFLADFNVLDLLNDPKALLEGVDLILATLDEQVVGFLDDLNLPVIGANLAAGVTIFQDLRFDIIEPALAFASTPDENGNLPTTVGLLTGLVNDQLNDLFGTDGETYLQAFLDTSGSFDESYLYGALSFSGEIFSAALDIGFDFGIPGFELEVEEGTSINLAATYDANIGFGIDKNGFFLLNDTDEDEISIDFVVDAGNFQGSFEVAGLLRASAFAIDPDDLDANGFGVIPDYDAGERGKVGITVGMGIDLFGEAGTAETRDLSGIDLTKRAGTPGEVEVNFENTVRMGQLSFSELAEFSLVAEADLNLQLIGEVIDPTSGNPVQLGGVDVIPRVVTELLIDIDFDLENGLQIEQMEFNQLRLDASALYESFIAPVIDPIRPFTEPFSDIADLLDVFPLDLALGAASTAFPVIGLAANIIDIIDTFNDLADTLDETGGFLVFGDFDFGASADDLASGERSSSSLSMDDFQRDASSASSGIPDQFGRSTGGLVIDVPLISDPSNALNLILGKFDEVDIIRANFSLINIPEFDIDIVGSILDTVPLPGKIEDAIASIFTARVFGKAFVGFEVGYDLGGVVNFINTFDPERLLDGLFLDSTAGGLVDFRFGAELGLDLDLFVIQAFARGAFEIFFQLGFNDPNEDGKLRLPELEAVLDQAFDADGFIEFIETVFVGDAGFELFAEVGGRLIIPAVNLGLFSTPEITLFEESFTLIDIDEEISFGGNQIQPKLATDLSETGGSAVLNIGSRITESFSSATVDGDDVVRISGPNSPIDVTLQSNGRTVTDQIDQSANAIIIPAGEGKNTVDLSAVTTVPTLTFTGGDDDIIMLPDTGFHVVFSGGGTDTITTSETATGTYWIFAEDGSDRITVAGGDTLVFAADEFGLRDAFIAEFMSGGFSQSAAEALLASHLNSQFGQTLDQFIADYTATTQMTANKDADTISVSSGTVRVFAGSGNDTISAGDGSGDVTVLGGAGNDRIAAHGGTVFIEGGAGSDLIEVEDGDAEIYGWGKVLGETGKTGDKAINALALRDGDDVILSGAGDDMIFGQRGNNIIAGGLGDDTIHGGRGDDIVTGGEFALETIGGAIVDASTLIDGLKEVLLIKSVVQDDGADQLFADGGGNVVLGGGGADRITGGEGSSVLVGDFASIEVSSNRVVQGLTAAGLGDASAGVDTITGGDGADVIIGGGGAGGAIETLTDTGGSNVIIGDSADIGGARILEKVQVVTSVADTAGNNDSITGGGGTDIIFGGEGDDTISDAGGSNVVAGDNALFERAAGSGLIEGRSHGEFAGIVSELAGDDVITIADSGEEPVGGFQPIQMVIGGGGDDTITLGDGGHTVLADDGAITFDPLVLDTLQKFEPFVADSEVLTPEEETEQAASLESIDSFGGLILKAVVGNGGQDGDDTVIIGDGDNKVILGDGADDLTVGAGDNIAIGDDGTIDLIDLSFIAGTTATSGNDTIRSGAGVGMFAGGGGDDEITLGAGGNFLLGDGGVVTFAGAEPSDDDDAPRFTPLTLTALSTEFDGSDTVTAGDGDNFGILGGAGDSLMVGAGNNTIITDGGSINLVTGTLTNDASDLDGDDTVVAGDGVGQFIGGSGSDLFTLGAGGNFLLGDSGTITYDVDTDEPLTLVSDHNALDGDDTVTAGDGANFGILGGGADRLTVGEGDNVVITGGGSINLVTGTLTNDASDLDGDDTVVAGDGVGQFIGGSGSDLFTLGAGGNFLLGDSGTITYDVDTDEPLTLVSDHNVLDGDDTVTAGDGVNFGILGAGADLLEVGDGNNSIITGGGSINLVTGTLTNDANALDGDDTVRAGDGVGQFVGGSGSDLFELGSGGNFLLGDSGLIDFDPATGKPLLLTSDHNVLDGDDTVAAGDGDNFGILGAGADLLEVGDGNNSIITGGGSINLVTGTLTNDANALDGDDTVRAGDGVGQFVGGSGSDLFELGSGGNFLLGDSGLIDFDPVTGKPLLLTSDHNVLDGDDTVTAGDGDNFGILGGGDDLMTVGDGSNIVITDGGEIDLVQGLVTNVSDTLAGEDTLVAGDGSGILVGGSFDDELTVGNGDNFILGDTGVVQYDPATFTAKRLTSVHDILDGDDIIRAGNGDSRAILGGANDDAIFGNGDNLVIADGGEISLVAGTLTNASDALAGADTVVAGNGDGMFIGGSFDDTLTLGNGDNLILSDTGKITYAPTSFAPVSQISRHDALDGSDTVTAGNGANRAVLGGENDLGTFGDGGNIVLGDSGSVTEKSANGDRTLLSTDPGTGGADTIIAGTGNDVVIGGDEGDTITIAAGDNVVSGDSAVIRLQTGADTNRLLQLNAVAPEIGGSDTVTTGGGNDVVVGGTDADLLTTQAGEDNVAGDWVSISTPLNGGGTGSVRATHFEVFGDDTISTGRDNDLVIGGRGDDLIAVGQGFDTGAADNVDFTYVNFTDVDSIVLTDLEAGGDDTIGATGNGDNILIGQAGADQITGGNDDDILIGDHTLIEFLLTDVYGLGESQVERMSYMEYFLPEFGANDTIRAGAGRDIVLGGFGDDDLFGEAGQDFIVGDTFIIQRFHDFGQPVVQDKDVIQRIFTFDQTGAPQRELIYFDSNFAFLEGGFDRISGGSGADIMVGHLGPDFFVGNTENDFLAGDTVALDIRAFFATGDFDATRQLDVIRTNFPGLGAQDVVSAGQVNSSVGAPLEEREREAEEDDGDNAPGTRSLDQGLLRELLENRSSALFVEVVSVVNSDEVLEMIIQLINVDMDQATLMAMLKDTVISLMTSADISGIDQILLERMVEKILKTTIQEIVSQPSSVTASTATVTATAG